MRDRRKLLAGLAGVGSIGVAASAGFTFFGGVSFPSEGCACLKTLDEWCAELEARTKQRIGVYQLNRDTAENERGYRWDEHFAMCSTFKWVLAAAILKAVDGGFHRLDELVKFTKKDVLEYAPVVQAHLAQGQLTLSELCVAAVSVSDNSAANLLLPLIGGPKGLTDFVRTLGDTETLFDRYEPWLNSNEKDDLRDTTTPKAMALLLQKVFFEKVLSGPSVSLLKHWMVEASTGRDLIRAGVPENRKAVVADKTGRGANGALNDVAVIWSENEPPEIVCIYTSGGRLSDAERREVMRRVADYVFTGG
ncbi:class A beta-lactamase [Asticcacaulis sp. DW145]|uniref:Beta-lactamase n=1 Tax=Asticcacaulis currens TaxID=2984210 RepID=A0ABT5IE68_9CAUL|nr:class A beta-lactamase [Asticcacaulis currens]BEV10293.1 class A beta-lactamase [Asticcacaulis sp. DW145]